MTNLIKACVSPFLPRSVTHSAYYAVARCLSVCLSVCHTLILIRPYTHVLLKDVMTVTMILTIIKII